MIVRSKKIPVEVPERPAIDPPKRKSRIPLRDMTDAAALSAPDGSVLVRMTSYGTDNLREVKIPVPVIEGPPAKVRVSGGVTRSLGNFEFARIDVAVELPCQPNKDDIDHTYDFASRTVEDYLSYEIGEVDDVASLEERL